MGITSHGWASHGVALFECGTCLDYYSGHAPDSNAERLLATKDSDSGSQEDVSGVRRR